MSEENLNNGEQPSCAEVLAVATGFDNGTDMQDGSPLGKFKDASTLLDAYNELQSEFTRKCQRLSDAEKKLSKMSVDNISRDDDTKSLNEFAWNDKISEFLDSHKIASGLVEDIINELIEDETLMNKTDGLDKAYTKALEKKYIPHSELANNKDFLEKYIYSNDLIKNKIIDEYVSTLQQYKSPITVTNDGYSCGVATGNKFGSLEEARKYVENMFRF